MKMVDAVLGIGLVAGLFGMGVLLQRTPAEASVCEEHPPSEQESAARAHTQDVCETALRTCRAMTHDCQGALAFCRTDRLQHLPPAERFQQLAPGDHRADGYLASLKRALSKVEDIEYQVECRELLCRVDIEGRDLAQAELAVQLHPAASRVKSMGIESREDPPKKIAWVDLHPPGMVVGFEILWELLREFEQSDARERCWAAHPTEGKLVAHLKVMPEDGIELQASDSLADTPVGQCLVDALRQLVDAKDVPANTIGAVLYYTIDMPPGDAKFQGNYRDHVEKRLQEALERMEKNRPSVPG